MAQSKPDFENHDPTVEVPYAFSSYTEAMKKCTRDNREFKVIVLENQMEIMLINDPEAVNACGALNLLAGSGLDPPGLHGLANLTLKWMMRASKAYPTDGQIHNFIKEHRGIIYSHTTLKTTEISFGLPAEELKETLERLASHLSDPLFQRQAAEKVVHEIDLDHRKFLKQENMSIKLLERNFFKPQDKMTHFKTGNRETLLVNPPKLGIDIHQEAVKFFDCYYSSNLMKMVILGNQGLPTLTEWAINTFSTIYNKIVPVPQLERIPLPADFNRQILVKSHQHTRSLVLLFPLFCQANGLATDEWAPALAYIRHLLELRTPGSIIHYLNKKGWGTYIHTSDIMDMDCDTPFFKLTISLTKVGFEAYEEVVRAVFQYMYMIRRAGIQHWLYDEIRSIAAIKFFMRAKYNDFDCPRFSDMMARDDLAPNMYVCDHAMYYQCNPDVIHQALACFHPKNFAVLVVSRDIESPGMSREMYYETKYQVTSLPLTLQMALANLKRNDKFFLPSKNPYVIERWENLESSGQPDKSISILSDTPQSRCWYFRTNHFTPPRSNIHIALQSPLSFKTPASSVRTKIMIKLLQERCKKLIDSSSSAGAASMFYSIDAGPDGIQISLEGFNEKNDLMLTNVFTALHDIKVDPYRLKFFIDEYILDLNCDSSQNSECPTMFIESALKGYVWPHDVQLNELRTITVSDISQFIQNYLNRTHVEMFVTGNATETEALDYLHLAERYMKRTSVLKVERYTNTSMHIPLGGRFLY
ncbi:Metalloenzyme, LuxS/M16 peptidase-like protein, partial [Dimargaris cristalligena]